MTLSRLNLMILFIGEASYKFGNQMVSLIKATYDIKVLPIFTSSKIGDYFSLKCGTPLPYSSNLVYKFSCLRDAGCSYIGQTKRHLLTRVNEHLSLHQPDGPQSEIKTHIYNCTSCHSSVLGIDNFLILKKCKNQYDTKFSEALKLKKCRPKLNKQLVIKGVSYLLKVF